ncbi:MAG: ArsR/SmtB family transcription factor [Halanaerobiales bacterium]
MENILKDMEEIEEKAKILKVLSHPIRLCIVKGLIEKEGYNVSEMQRCLDIPQSTLSQHLSKLKDLNILEVEKNGLERNYYVINKDSKKVIKTLFPNI